MAAPIPPCLGFLAIYNPSLARTDKGTPTVQGNACSDRDGENKYDDDDEELAEGQQIIYYATPKTLARQQQYRRRRRRDLDDGNGSISPAERRERLLQIGLAQGMVEFGAGFAAGAPVDAVETEKARVFMHELEPGWWILASIDLGRVPLPPRLPTSSVADQPPEQFEYSSRDIKPAALLLQDLLRAHSTFLLHHDTSLSALFVRSRRPRFVALLSRYWDLFLSTWSVALRGNPARDLFGAINVAASGELGVGVGEEHRGSGEREVLEGLVGRIEGLLDLVVSRFGTERDEDAAGTGAGREPVPWLGAGLEPAAEDGAIFLGVGALSRKSVKDVTHWMEDIYTWGENAYGVFESPTSTRPSRRPREAASAKRRDVRKEEGGERSLDSPPTKDAKKRQEEAGVSENPARAAGDANRSAGETSTPRTREDSDEGTTVDSGTISQKAAPTDQTEGDSTPKSPRKESSDPNVGSRPNGPPPDDAAQNNGHMDKFVNYLKLGYGTYWSLGTATTEPSSQQRHPSLPGSSPSAQPNEGSNNLPRGTAHLRPRPEDTCGHFLVGLVGDIEESTTSLPHLSFQDDNSARNSGFAGSNSRTRLRTLHVELEAEARDRPEAETVCDLGTLFQQGQEHKYTPDQSPMVDGDDDNDDDDDDDDDVFSRSQSHSRTTAAGRSASAATGTEPGSGFGRHDRNKAKKLRVVVYANRPFVFAFLFRLRTDSLELDSLYRSLHHQLAPLRKPLLASTAYRPPRPETERGPSAAGGIYDLVWDPRAMTVHCTIPNIPAALPRPRGSLPPWMRAEAINTHAQLTALFSATRSSGATGGGRGGVLDPDLDLERTCKTSRGWWIVWTRIVEGQRRGESPMRRLSQVEEEDEEDDGADEGGAAAPPMRRNSSALPSSSSSPPPPARAAAEGPVVDREIFLLRRASDHAGLRGVSGTFAVDMGTVSPMGSGSSSGSGGDTAGKLAQGIGVDTRKYIESLLNAA